MVIICNVTIGFVQEYKAERALEALNKFSIISAVVMRDGVQQTVPATELVPGDIVVLDEGNQVCIS